MGGLLGLLLLSLGVAEFIGVEEAWAARFSAAILLTTLAAVVIGGGALLHKATNIESTLAKRPAEHYKDKIAELGNGPDVATDELLHAVERLERFFAEGVLILHGRRAFQGFWIRALNRYAGSHIVATSLTSKVFFWNNDDDEIHNALQANRRERGSVTRVFLLNGATPTEEDLRVMHKHKELGVEVHYVDKNAVPPDLREIGLADRALRFGWITKLRMDDIETAHIYTKREQVEPLRDNILKLLKMRDIVTELKAN